MSQLTSKQFAKLYDAHMEKVYRFLLTKVGSVEQAQDLTSETFLKAWDYMQKDSSEVENFQAFVFRIARNTTIDFYRKKSSGEISVDMANTVYIDSIGNKDKITDSQGPLAQAAIASDLDYMQKCLSKISPSYADVLTLHYVEDVPIAEVAKVMGKSEGATRVMISRAISELRKHME